MKSIHEQPVSEEGSVNPGKGGRSSCPMETILVRAESDSRAMCNNLFNLRAYAVGEKLFHPLVLPRQPQQTAY